MLSLLFVTAEALLILTAVQEAILKKQNVKRMFALGLLVLLAVVLTSCTANSAVQSGQQAAPTPGMGAPGGAPGTPGARSFDFPGLEGISQDQLFDHFLGGQFNLTDRNNNPFTLKMTPGTVSSATNTSIVITPNGQTSTQTYNITGNTVVHGMPGRGTIDAIVAGEKVVVVTRDSSMDAVFIAEKGPMYHKRMMESMMPE